MGNNIDSIPTAYAGVTFRSRLEARWAVFFDAVKLRWLYEPEAFRLRNGEIYLPDFWLPDFPEGRGIFVEVKPGAGDARVLFDKAIRFSVDHRKPIWLCDDTPDFRVTHELSMDGALSFYDGIYDAAFEARSPVIPLADQAEHENRFFVMPGYEDERGCFDPDYAGDTYTHAIARVRAHRFWDPVNR